MPTADYSPETHKIVLVLDEYLGGGLAANTAAVLSLSLGNLLGDVVMGPALTDSAGAVHEPITNTPMPILKAEDDALRELVVGAKAIEGVVVIDVTNAAQTTKNYDDYSDKLSSTPADELTYLGVAICGPKKSVNKLTGSFSLFR